MCSSSSSHLCDGCCWLQKERLKEIERRKTGQSVQQLKQFQHERELQEVREQLKKEKEEERKARERVKQDIERDR